MSQENNFIPNQKEYCKLRPFPLFIKNNFPFIENTYESLDIYGLLCKVVEFLNKVIENENIVTENQEAVYDAFVQLNTYVSEYFDNLDVQEEINNKLDEMVEDGTLPDIIESYLKSIALFVFDNVQEMIISDNLIDGSYAKTYGFHNINDGGSAFYKIRKITAGDVIDNMFIIGMNNDSDLVAELIIENDTININQLGAKGDNTTDNTLIIQAAINYFSNKDIKGKIFIPSGTYLIDTIVIDKDVKGLTIEGLNATNYTARGSCLKGISSANNTLIDIGGYTGSSIVIDNFTPYIILNNLFLDCSNKENGIYLKESTQCKVSNCRLFNFTNNGIKLRTVFDSLFENVYINSNNLATAVYFETSTINNTNACRFINCDFEANLKGFEFNNCNQIMITDTKIENSPILIKSAGMINFLNCLLTPKPYSQDNDHYIKFNGISKTNANFMGCSFDCSGYGEDGAMIIDYTGVQGGVMTNCNFNNVNSLYNTFKLNNKQIFENNNISINKKTNTQINTFYVGTKCVIKNNIFFMSGFLSGSLFNLNGNYNVIEDNQYTDEYLNYTRASTIFNLSTYNKNKISPLTQDSINNSTGNIDMLESHNYTITANVQSITHGNSSDVLYLFNNTGSALTIPAALIYNSSSDVSIPSVGVCTLLNKNGNWYKI